MLLPGEGPLRNPLTSWPLRPGRRVTGSQGHMATESQGAPRPPTRLAGWVPTSYFLRWSLRPTGTATSSSGEAGCRNQLSPQNRCGHPASWALSLPTWGPGSGRRASALNETRAPGEASPGWGNRSRCGRRTGTRGCWAPWGAAVPRRPGCRSNPRVSGRAHPPPRAGGPVHRPRRPPCRQRGKRSARGTRRAKPTWRSGPGAGRTPGAATDCPEGVPRGLPREAFRAAFATPGYGSGAGAELEQAFRRSLGSPTLRAFPGTRPGNRTAAAGRASWAGGTTSNVNSMTLEGTRYGSVVLVRKRPVPAAGAKTEQAGGWRPRSCVIYHLRCRSKRAAQAGKKQSKDCSKNSFRRTFNR
jgi:hypothetical protein